MADMTGTPRTTWSPGWYRSEDSGEIIHVSTHRGRRAIYRGLLGTQWAPSDRWTMWMEIRDPYEADEEPQ